MNLPLRFFTFLQHPPSRQVIVEWRRQILSPAIIWIVLPAAAGLVFVYLAVNAGWPQLILKPRLETIAIIVLSLAVVIFLARAFLFRLKLDYLLLIMAINFLCREIHFTGTDNGVVIVAAVAIGLFLFWGEQVLSELKTAPLVRLTLTGTFLTYLLGQLIQRRVFKSGRIPLLPDEALLHVPLEEVTENIAHLYFIFIGIAGFKELPPGDKGREKSRE